MCWVTARGFNAFAGARKQPKPTQPDTKPQSLNPKTILPPINTEGERSPKWVEGHGIRLRLHLIPFFGKMCLSEINAGTVQDYRVHRIGSSTTGTAPARSTLHDEVGTLRQVLKTAIRHKWLTHLPGLSPPYKTQGKITHRPWFSPVEYKQLYEATRQNAKEPKNPHFRWEAEQ